MIDVDSKLRMPAMAHTDDVRGVVIGEVSTDKHYVFYDNEGQAIAGKDCQNDQDAVAWFETTYPSRFAAGVEMRVWE